MELHETIRKVAATNANVLLVGETGTGKELFARAIHTAGPKREEKFLAVNCGARPVEFWKASSSARKAGPAAMPTQPGLFRHAGEGTVYFDEVTLLPSGIQAELLRAIEYQEIMPVGGSETAQVKARIIASTTHDLMQDVAEDRFQEDLFYRLNGMRIHIPPLRERLDDIPELVEFFIGKHSMSMGKRVIGATSETIRLLDVGRVERQRPPTRQRHRTGGHDVRRPADRPQRPAAGTLGLGRTLAEQR